MDSKVYDSAVLRTLGMTKFNMLGMMMIYAAFQSIFAIFFGFIASWRFMEFINGLLKSLGLTFGIGFDAGNVVISLLLAFGLPMFSVLRPLMGLLGNNIASALDKDHSLSSSVRVTVENLEKRFPIETFSIALVSSAIGVSIYILMPLSLFTGSVTLFVIIFFGLLIGLMVGLMMILVNFSYFFEWILLLPLVLER